MLQPRYSSHGLSCPLIFLITMLTLLLLPSDSLVSGENIHSHFSKSTLTFPTVEVYEVKREYMAEINNVISSAHHHHLRTSSLQMLNVSRNSDLVFGENTTAQNSGLLLQCQAPYSVQWIFRGDSDPEFSTNTSTTTDAESGTNSYSAYLFMGARRNVNEQETGKYICTSVRNKRLFSYVYIFVTGSALFTAKGLETVHYSPNDDSIRIPCSLSEPKAITALQKSENGVLTCPMSDSVRFDPKDGFFLSLKGLPEPQGTYLCIADYNNTFQIIKYTVVRDDQDHLPSSPSSPTSEEYEPHEPSEFEPPHQHQSTPAPIGASSCRNVTCGENAHCVLNLLRDAVCRCNKDYIGNPFVKCKPKSLTTTSTTTPSSKYPILTPGDSSSSEGNHCESYDDCSDDRTCIKNKCQNPCNSHRFCGPNTICEAKNHTPYCQCKNGYIGEPYSSKEGEQCERNYCDPNPCGQNTNCMHVKGKIISCSCKPGYATQPGDDTCRPRQKIESPSPIVSSTLGTSTTLRPTTVRNRYPYPSQNFQRPPSPPRPHGQNRTMGIRPQAISDRKECHYDTDCPDDKMCVQDKCENPCVNACGAGALCHTRNHFPRCVCPEGTFGDPFYKCSPRFSGVLGSSPSSLPATPESIVATSNNYYGQVHDLNQIHCGGRHSPCGPNSICQATRRAFVCSCPNNYIGDPYSAIGCRRTKEYQKCEKDDDCPHFLTCLRLQGCVNPCSVRNVCKHGRSCVPFLHRPACVATANFIIDLPRIGELKPDNESKETNSSGEHNTEHFYLDMQEEFNNNSCFLRSDNKILSPCGQNSVCYDSVLTSKAGAFCGCMENFVGDPYIGCEPMQACNTDASCGSNEKCDRGFCRQVLGGNTNHSDSMPEANNSTNPCFPSPCSKHGDECVINVENYSAECVSPGHSIIEPDEETSLTIERFRSRSDNCQLTGNCEEGEGMTEQQTGDEVVDDLTTELPFTSTILPSTSISAASEESISSTLAPAQARLHSVDTLNYSREAYSSSSKHSIEDA